MATEWGDILKMPKKKRGPQLMRLLQGFVDDTLVRGAALWRNGVVIAFADGSQISFHVNQLAPGQGREDRLRTACNNPA